MNSNSSGHNANRSAIEEVLKSNGGLEEAIISGRVIGILDGEGPVVGGVTGDLIGEKGFILKDETEKIVVLTEKKPAIGSIVEVKVGEIKAGQAKL